MWNFVDRAWGPRAPRGYPMEMRFTLHAPERDKRPEPLGPAPFHDQTLADIRLSRQPAWEGPRWQPVLRHLFDDLMAWCRPGRHRPDPCDETPRRHARVHHRSAPPACDEGDRGRPARRERGPERWEPPVIEPPRQRPRAWTPPPLPEPRHDLEAWCPPKPRCEPEPHCEPKSRWEPEPPCEPEPHCEPEPDCEDEITPLPREVCEEPGPRPEPHPNYIRVEDGKVKIGERYTMRFDERDANWWVEDHQDGHTFRVWGDPHVDDTDAVTGASRRWDFKKNSTFVLEDGTKITVHTTNQTRIGESYSSRLVITNSAKGESAAEVTGLGDDRDGANNLKVVARDNGTELDEATHDGAFRVHESGKSWSLNGKPVTQEAIDALENAAR